MLGGFMILCLSDIHNSNVLHKIRKLLDLHSEIDAVFFLGDLSHHTEFAEGFIKLFHDAAIPFYCVPGNNDPLPVRELMNKMKCNVEEQEKMFMTWRVVGLGGSPVTPFNTVYEKTEDKIKKQMSRMNIDNNTIILSHTPPYGVLDTTASGLHIGSKAVLQMIKERQPFAVFCGHVHEAEGYEKIGETHIFKIPAVRNGKYAIVNLDSIDYKVYEL